MKKIILIMLVLCSNYLLHAQPFSLDKNLKLTELKLQAIKPNKDSLKGSFCIKEFKQTSDTAYYFVKGLGIFQTGYFSYVSLKSNDDTQIYLCKNSWNKADRTLVIKNGTTAYKFRTEGSYGIMVVQKREKIKYSLTVWQSEEPKKIPMKSPFKTK